MCFSWNMFKWLHIDLVDKLFLKKFKNQTTISFYNVQMHYWILFNIDLLS